MLSAKKNTSDPAEDSSKPVKGLLKPQISLVFDDGESKAPSSSSTVVEPRRSKRVNVSESVCGKNSFWAKSSKTLEHTLHRISALKNVPKIS